MGNKYEQEFDALLESAKALGFNKVTGYHLSMLQSVATMAQASAIQTIADVYEQTKRNVEL